MVKATARDDERFARLARLEDLKHLSSSNTRPDFQQEPCRFPTRKTARLALKTYHIPASVQGELHQKPSHPAVEILPLRHTRKGRFTQTEIAARAGLSLQTVRQLERGRGLIASLAKLTTALGVTVEGRNLPPGASLGKRLAALRRRRGFTQRSLAAALRVAPGTVNRLENTEAASVAILCRVMTFLGAGAYLAAPGAARAFYTHAGNASVYHRWQTPPALLQRLYAVSARLISTPVPRPPTAGKRRCARGCILPSATMGLPCRGMAGCSSIRPMAATSGYGFGNPASR